MARSFWAWLTRQASAKSASRGHNNKRHATKKRPVLELLESRDLPSTFEPGFLLHPQSGGVKPFLGNGSTAMALAQIRQAYGFTGLADGAGTTIAIVDAYNDPNVAADLDVFDNTVSVTAGGPTLLQQYGPASSFFKVLNQTGGTSLPRNNTGWAEEIALDVEWAHAIAPGAKIILVEASSATDANLFTAVATAAAQPNVVAVSMSWGGGEFSGQTTFDGYLKKTGVTFVVSSGDSGAPASYPSSSPNALSVGGTTLNVTSAGNITSETTWTGSGGGVSSVEALPSYQQGIVPPGTVRRATPDVAYDADPNTGFPVYNSYSFSPSQAWEQFGGTSAAAPQWAALIAIADEGRINAGLGSLTGYSQTLPMLYSLPGSDFHDISTGNSTGSPPEYAGQGYDLATGRGSPIANLIVAGLGGSGPITPVATHFSVSAASSSTAGSAITVTVTALSATNATVTGYTGIVHITSSDGQAVLPANATLVGGVGTFTVTLKTAGSRSIAATDSANSSITGSTTVTVAAASPYQLAFGQQPTTALAGAVISPAVTVRVLDQYNNIVSSDNTDQVTLALGNNAGPGTLSGSGPMTVSGGIATFTGVSIDTPGTDYTLNANAGLPLGATSASFNITAPVATHFGVSATFNQTAGVSFTVTVTALDASNHTLPSYAGIVKITSSDQAAVLPANATLVGGVGNFTVTLKTAGNQSVIATDTSASSVTGSAPVSVAAASANQLVFGQQPTNTVAGAVISPNVTVRVLDQYGNLVTADNSNQVTVAIGNNAGGGTLSGPAAVTVNGGIATFPGLSIDTAGAGYTLTGAAPGLAGATSASFNITAAGSTTGSTTIESFETSDTWNIVGGTSITAMEAGYAAHDGSFGLDQLNNNEWIYRNDAAAQVKAGDTISVWLKFAGAANGRAYFGFGASAAGTLSLVAAPNTGQLVLQQNLGYGYVDLAAVSQIYLANHWYRLEVDWGTSGKIIGNLFDSNGTTLLRSVAATTTAITSGGIAFRTIGNDKYWDTVTATYGVNPFGLRGAVASNSGTTTNTGGSGSGGSAATPCGSQTPSQTQLIHWPTAVAFGSTTNPGMTSAQVFALWGSLWADPLWIW